MDWCGGRLLPQGGLCLVDAGAAKLGLKVPKDAFFDTVSIEVKDAAGLVKKAVDHVIPCPPLFLCARTLPAMTQTGCGRVS